MKYTYFTILLKIYLCMYKIFNSHIKMTYTKSQFKDATCLNRNVFICALLSNIETQIRLIHKSKNND